MSPRLLAASPCPCGLPARYSDCCGRFHAGERHLAAPSAEALMRSRYTAYTLGLTDYLLATWHPSTRPDTLDLSDSPKWLGLTISAERSASMQKNDGNATFPIPTPHDRVDGGKVHKAEAFVEFVARYKVGGRAHRLHETSRFTFEDGHWYYVDGNIHS